MRRSVSCGGAVCPSSPGDRTAPSPVLQAVSAAGTHRLQAAFATGLSSFLLPRLSILVNVSYVIIAMHISQYFTHYLSVQLPTPSNALIVRTVIISQLLHHNLGADYRIFAASPGLDPATREFGDSYD